MKYKINYTSKFKKDLKKAKSQGKNIKKLYDIIEKLSSGETLDLKYKNHILSGKYLGCNECHIEPDWLFIYNIIEDKLVVIALRIGSHSDLFK